MDSVLSRATLKQSSFFSIDTHLLLFHKAAVTVANEPPYVSRTAPNLCVNNPRIEISDQTIFQYFPTAPNVWSSNPHWWQQHV